MAGCSGPHHGGSGGYGESSTQGVVPQVKELVEKNVKDPDKAKKVEDMINQIVAEVKRSSEETRGFHEQLNTLNADYGAKPEQFTKILDELNNNRMASAGKILGMRFKIKDMLTAEEWKSLTDAMNQSRKRYEKHAPAS